VLSPALACGASVVFFVVIFLLYKQKGRPRNGQPVFIQVCKPNVLSTRRGKTSPFASCCAWPWLHLHLRAVQVLSPLGKQVSYSWAIV